MTDQPGSLREQLDRELEGLERELAEITLLVEQARTEATRLEQKRAQAEQRLAGIAGSGQSPELTEASAGLVTLTKRAAIMESQVDVVAGKVRTLERYRDSLARVRGALADDAPPGVRGALADSAAPGVRGALADSAAPGTRGAPAVDAAPGAPESGLDDPSGGDATPADGRAVLAAQEEMRREIARALHDGPAQSLANIVLQAQIVDRLVETDPAAARAEVSELVAMVQRTLETTKSFIFDVRPMVLDDLGLVPTLRRAARERSRRSGIPVSFDSVGADRRLSTDLESAVFRIAEEAADGLVADGPQSVALVLDWGDSELVLTVRATHRAKPELIGAESRSDMPAALREMVDERLAREAARKAAREAESGLDATRRRVIVDRAAAANGRAAFASDGRELTARFPIAAEPVR